MYKFKLLIFIFFVVFASICFGQYNTATINNIIDPNEYGTGNVNMYPSGAAQWYITWDANFVYLSIQNANETEAAIVYFDVNPIIPINGGANANGNLNGLPGYDNLTPRLPFRADAAIYVKNNWRSLLIANGTGGWTVVSAGASGLSGFGDDYLNGYYSSHDNFNGAGGDDRREMKIAWSALTAGGAIPASFCINGYIAYTCGNTCGGMYASMPAENPAGSLPLNSTPNLVRYFGIGTTTNGAATPPFSRNSYTYINGGSNTITNFGFISVWDFTMNTPGDTIVRSITTGGDWYIGGSLIVNRGAIYFGPVGGINYGESFVNNVRVYTRGTLDLDYTNRPLRVSGDMELIDYNNATDSVVFELSQTAGGDLWLYGNLRDSTKAKGVGGKTYRGFGPRDRQVWFRGNTQQNIFSYTNDLTFDYVRIENGAHVNLVTGKISEYKQLDLINGHIILNNNNWIMENANAVINFVSANSYVVTNGTGYLWQKQLGVGGKTGNVLFPIGNSISSYRPCTVNNTSGGLQDSVKARVIDGAFISGTTGAAITTAFVNKTWLIEKSTNANCTYTLQYQLPDELPAFDRNFCSMMYQSAGIYTNTGPFGANALGANPYTVSQANITVTDTFSIASVNPLPLKWLSFTATKHFDNVFLNWKVNDESTCTHYEIERSTDAQNFLSIGLQNATSGNPNFVAEYNFTDYQFSQIQNDVVFYRIKQWNTNGSFSYSQIRFLHKKENDDFLALEGYNGDMPVINIHTTTNHKAQLFIIDSKGALVLNKKIEITQGDNILKVENDLAPGIYTIHVYAALLNLYLRIYVK